MTTVKKFCLNCIILLVFFLCCVIGLSMMFPICVQAEESHKNRLSFTQELKDFYAVGDTVVLPSPAESLSYYVLIEKKEGNTLKIKKEIADIYDNKYTFDESGDYIISYVYKDGDKNRNINFNITVNKDKIGFDFSVFPSKMSINESVEFGNIYYYSKQVKLICDVFVLDPNGNSIDVSNGIFKPEAIGVYTITAKRKVSGITYSEKIEVEVYAGTAELFLSDSVSAKSDYDLPSWSPKGNGVLLYTTQINSVARYANVIDLSKLNPNTPLIKFQVLYGDDATTGMTFSTLGEMWQQVKDYCLKVKITDVYDPTKYVTFSWRAGEYWMSKNPSEKGFSYLMTCPSDSDMAKWGDFGGDGNVDTQYCTFYGASGSMYGGAQMFDVSYNYNANKSFYNNGNSLFADYSDTNKWGKYAFDKFTTGEVYLDVCFPRWDDGNYAGIVVTEVGGLKLSGKNVSSVEDVSADTINDMSAPSIKIENDDDYMEQMPNGLVGKEYRVPTAYSVDTLSGKGSVYVYVSLNDKQYTIKDNTFIPDVAGKYKINYVANDAFGNVSTETLTVDVVDNISLINFIFNDEIIPVVGKYVNFGSVVVSGGSGKISYGVDIYYNGDKVQTDNFNKLYLDKEGKLKIVFNATDYLGTQIEKSVFEFDVVKTDEVYIDILGYVAKYAQKGTTVILPEFEAVSFNGDDVITKSVYINGRKIDGYTYLVNEEVGDVITVTYSATNKGVEYKEEFEIEVVEEYKGVENGFVTENATAELSENYLVFTLNDDAKIASGNAVMCKNFQVSFKVSFEKMSYIDLAFIDVFEKNSITIRLAKSNYAGKVDMKVNDGKVYTFSPNNYIDGYYEISLKCNMIDGRIATSSDVTICMVNKFDSGYPFNGFTDDIMYVSFEFTGCENNTTFYLNTFGNQAFNAFSNIIAYGPQIKTKTEFISQDIEKNTTVVIPEAKGYDLFDGECEVFVTVTSPSGLKLITMKSCTSENSFIADKEGSYVVTFTSYDNHDGLLTLSYRFVVADKDDPVINVNTNTIKAKVGEKVLIPKATVTDNVTKDMEYYVFAILTYGRYVPISGNEYTFTEKGKYEIVYVAIDEQDNISRKTISVIVTE